MRLLSKTLSSINSYRDSDAALVETVVRWLVRVDARGREHEFVFDHDPTDDEIQARIPGPIATVRPTSLADRVEAAAELAAVWNALRLAATEAATDAAFTAAERTRLSSARDLARAALRAYV